MKKQAVVSVLVFLGLVGMGAAYRMGHASDHDDGEHDVKSRALNLTDHFVWKDDGDSTKINFVQNSNPRALQSYPYFFSTQARYEIHVGHVADKTIASAPADDHVFRFEFGTPDATTGTQNVTFTWLQSGNSVGSNTFASTAFFASQAGTLTTPTISVNGKSFKVFAGMREDTFFFDVQRYFEVRTFLALAFVSGKDAVAVLKDFRANHHNCDNKSLSGAEVGDAPKGSDVTGTGATTDVHLFNPAICASDFTKLYNVNAIALQATISDLGGTVFDTWSTISVPQ